MVEKSVERTAYHEAGHVVAACLLNLEQHGATIVPEGEIAGQAYAPLMDAMRYEWPEGEADYLKRHLIVLFAEMKAVERVMAPLADPEEPNLDISDLESDYGQAADVVLNVAGPSEEEQLELSRWAQEEAESLLNANWAAVEAVASALLEHRTLSGTQCKKIVKESQR